MSPTSWDGLEFTKLTINVCELFHYEQIFNTNSLRQNYNFIEQHFMIEIAMTITAGEWTW